MNREVIRKLQFPLMIALILYPVCALVLGYADPALLKWRWLYPAALLLLSGLAMPIPGKLRMSFGLGGAGLLFLLGLFLSSRGADWKVWLLSAGTAAALLWSMKIGGWKPTEEIPSFWLLGGVATQLAARVVMVAMEHTAGKTLPTIQWEITLAFSCFLILAMLSMNRVTLNQASMGRTAASRSMRRKNFLMILAVFILAMLISMLPVFVNVAEWVAGKIWQAVMWVSSLFGGETVAGVAQMEQGSTGEQVEYGPFVYFAGKVIAFLIIAFIAVQVFLALKEVVKGLIDRMGRFASDAEEDFVDEVTDIREEQDHQARTRRHQRREDREMDSMTPVQQVRRQYRRLLRSHKSWGDARTARENIPEDMARIYEQARYSGGTVTEEEAKNFRSGTKSL